MTHTAFQALLERRLNLIGKTLNSKSKEYSTEDDKLHNFKFAADISDQHPALALDGMLMKHYVSYRDMLKGISEGKIYSVAYLDEKFGDIINYFILQEAIFHEHLEDNLGCPQNLD